MPVPGSASTAPFRALAGRSTRRHCLAHDHRHACDVLQR
jgi:hypothetical protein